MRFTVTGEQRKTAVLRTVIYLFLAYIFVHGFSNGAMYFNDMGRSYNAVVHDYLGNPAEFRQPRSDEGMLEVAHLHLFAMGILVLTLIPFMRFASLSDRAKQWGIWTPFLFAIGNEGAGWLVRFVAPEFAWLKIATVLGLELSLLWGMGVTLWSMITQRRGGSRVQPSSN